MQVQGLNIKTPKEDEEALSQKGLSAFEIARKLVDKVNKAQEVFKKEADLFIQLEDKNLAVVLPFGGERGLIKCLFCDHVTMANGQYEIINTETKTRLVFDDHNLHQIDKHHYFGLQAKRVDPIALSQILGLKK